MGMIEMKSNEAANGEREKKGDEKLEKEAKKRALLINVEREDDLRALKN